MILMVVYDLRGPAGSYADFFETLKETGSLGALSEICVADLH